MEIQELLASKNKDKINEFKFVETEYALLK